METDQMSRNAAASSDTPSSLTPAPFRHPSKPQALKTSGRSVSVQMSSSLSSHIVHRKDVPYKTVSKRILVPGILPLDTSTPFRAVQSWTDLQIQRNPLTRMVSHGAVQTARKGLPLSSRVTETRHGPTLKFSSSPCFPLLSDDWQSHRCLPGMTPHHRRMSVSVDKGMWSDEEEEVVSNGNEEEGKLWKENQTTTMACCCSCDHQFTCLTQKGYDSPYSPGELEEMMLCLQQFRSVLGNMEEQLSEEQAEVYSALSDQDRETVQDIKELRRAVKEEAGELAMQLHDLADHYDDGFKMGAVEMTTGCVRSTLEPERGPMTQENQHCEHNEEDPGSRKSEAKDGQGKEEALRSENREAEQKKKPRRKDTPDSGS
ncbi:hypothetical protein EYF80_028640 [Liparis tanakae]|uniref:Sperm-specific antigen 2 C-terminal domain-containing protein n=1 Tax=Liparis tanakae TaxID=230148 RepID=A0A4Z2H8M9_9TELE|nr:hypothetical protein EYF80_028640 [Liparis tanakae]